eukprot:332935-Alexandrium_andersonii.AAC.1
MAACHRAAGHEVNFARGKTEATLRLVGPKASDTWYSTLARDEDGSWCVRTPDGHSCRVVRSYKHLGVASSTAVSLSAEVSA